ncbi:hypothetical protein GGI25_006100 [Coemansia spiralis]|uniref:DUF2423 domain-containing protein n=2 Tax=Coemansia TaxID=4863 RepID=A0A9W8KU18_9FUNG|nr:hypothetical protein BX070DRAFT_223925 [Coemansia spiralis]KAJ1988286.1 hypothetical protein EDC05_005372 [Coemansia umbellata]KAJ2619884.1 hypothetical protein GGI26_005455 [Coemansia sp. RSA 1358]KAJ2669542.1 hypothetical protein GGI25_006100 [Coemansia spiralis]
MGKSARSKSQIKNRNLLRATVFGPHEAERIQRLAEKQKVTTGTTDLFKDMDVEMGSGGTASVSSSNNKKNKSKKRNANSGKRMVVRNKKGRVLSKNSVSWVKQKRFK